MLETCPTWVNSVKPLRLTIDLFSTFNQLLELSMLEDSGQASSAALVAMIPKLIASDSVTGLDLKPASFHFSAGFPL